jgi:hypothetical protein
MKTGNANGDDEMNRTGISKACVHLVAEGSFAAMGVGDYKKPLLSVDGMRWSLWANARALERDRRKATQAKNDGRDDRETHPAQRRKM